MHALEDERRRFKRFKVRNESSFVLAPEWPALGEVIDISEGGLAFTYVAEQEWPGELSEGGMVFGNHDSCLSNVPMNVVSDYVLPVNHLERRINLRRRCIEFGELTNEQKFLLECFIWINGEVEA